MTVKDSAMDKTDMLNKTGEHAMLGNDTAYYKYIFKKTEKIVCAVFFTLRSEQYIDREDVLVKDVESTAQRLLSLATKSLAAQREMPQAAVRDIGFGLIELESKLRVLNAARILPEVLLQVFVNEIDVLARGLKNYLSVESQNPLFDAHAEMPTAPTRTRNLPPKKTTERTDSSGAQGALSRRSRIMSVLKDKGQASIKDISEVIADCSEKTIQRELQSLVKDGTVVREGDRRWSRYSVV